jgi:KaiC/GvpD/RAD55 family RecA-like ATPase
MTGRWTPGSARLIPGRHYLITGSPGTGKTTVSLHFLMEGLEHGEACALLTQDDPDDLLAHGDYIGYDFRPAIREGRLIFLQFRVDFLRRYSRMMNPELVFEELLDLLTEDGLQPTRLVIDSVAPFLEGGHVSNDLVDRLGTFLRDWEGTTYVMVPGELREAAHRRLYDRVVSRPRRACSTSSGRAGRAASSASASSARRRTSRTRSPS